jgi:hypothetical protein
MRSNTQWPIARKQAFGTTITPRNCSIPLGFPKINITIYAKIIC